PAISCAAMSSRSRRLLQQVIRIRVGPLEPTATPWRRATAGNISPNSATASVTIADTTAPTTPTGLTAAVAGSTGANLAWSASTDNVGVTGYIVRRNGVQVATPAATSYTDTGLSAATTNSYTAAPHDAANNSSP